MYMRVIENGIFQRFHMINSQHLSGKLNTKHSRAV